MRQLIVSEFVTLDGVMEAPGGEPTHLHTGWVGEFDHEGWFPYKLAEILAAETLLVGRVTYESFAEAWPDREGEMADKLNSMHKVLVSSTIAHPTWNNTTLLEGGVAVGVEALKAGDGGPILVHGSAQLVHQLLDEDLVDELRLMVFPLTIGDGLRVFSGTIKKTVWRLNETQQFAGGVRVEAYRRA